MARRWTIRSETASTFPPPGLFTKDAEKIARVMATKQVSPKGLGSAIRMVQFLLNRGGRNLPARRRRELERAKRLLQARRARLVGRRPATSRA
jgi:tRNA(adenine34) deaminase